MDINKAIKKQKKYYKSFILSMCLIFLSLPIIMFIYGKADTFFIVYLLGIEILILVSIFKKIDNETLKFEDNKYNLNIKTGILRKNINIICDKVVMIHTEDKGKDFQIILITSSKSRNKRIKKVDYNFLKEHSYVSHHYLNIKKQDPEKEYYYLIIKNGGYNKYKLLDIIYKTCVYAYFTDESIEKIKLYRN